MLDGFRHRYVSQLAVPGANPDGIAPASERERKRKGGRKVKGEKKKRGRRGERREWPLFEWGSEESRAARSCFGTWIHVPGGWSQNCFFQPGKTQI